MKRNAQPTNPRRECELDGIRGRELIDVITKNMKNMDKSVEKVKRRRRQYQIEKERERDRTWQKRTARTLEM